MTALETAMRKAGIAPAVEYAFKIALAKFLNHGGTIERARQIVEDIATEMLGEGQPPGADNGRDHIAPVQQPHDGAAAKPPLSQDHRGSASAPSPRFQTEIELQAAKKVGGLLALNAFDKELTRNGRPWGNVFYTELKGMLEDGEVAAALMKALGPVKREDRFKRIRELMTVREFAAALREARA